MRDPTVVHPEDEGFIEVDPENPLPERLLPMGSLERAVGLPYEEALFLDQVDPEAGEYWFTEPPGGWNTEKRRLRRLVAEPELEPDAFQHAGAAAAGRTPLAAVREGQLIRGTVVAQLWYHGAQVDIGAEWDALLPCTEEQWEEAGPLLGLGAQVEVRVHRLREAPLHRFPIQVAAIDARLAALVVPPDEHEAPMDLRVMTQGPEEIAARSGGQRAWDVEEVVLQTQAEYDREMSGNPTGGDAPDIVPTPEQHAAMDAEVARLMGSFGGF